MFTIVPPTPRSKRAARTRRQPSGRSSTVQLWLEQLENRVMLSAGDSIANAIGLPLNNPAAPFQIVHQAFFKIEVIQPGNLTAQVDAAGVPTSLTLYDSRGIPIVQSDGQSGNNPDPSITQGLSGSDGGTPYYLKIASRSIGQSKINLTTLFTPSDSMLQTVPLLGGPTLLVTGDFNGDGRLDLVTVAEGSSQVTVLLSNGDGTFQKVGPAPTDAGIIVGTLAAGDFNGDGHLDLVAANNGTRGVSTLLGNGDGTFQDPKILDERGGVALAMGDFNGDGNLDLAVDYPGSVSGNSVVSGAISVLRGNGDGTFQSALISPAPAGSIGLVAGDFNADGTLDLAAANYIANKVIVFRGDGSGRFTSGGPLDAGMDPRMLVAGDFNGDGQLDLAAASYQGNSVTVLLNAGHGLLQTAGTYPVGALPESLLVADFNGDGSLDLATASYFSNNVSVLLGNGDGGFAGARSFAVQPSPAALVAGDFNGDGRLDLVAADTSSQQLELLLGNGDGTFPQTGLSNTTGQSPAAIVSGDFNGDGRRDLAVVNEAPAGTVTVLLGQGDGKFQKVGNVVVGNRPVALVAGDFNGDGRLDLAVADYDSSDIRVFKGQGDGTFEAAGIYSLPGTPAAVIAGDFHSNGRLDLVVALKFSGDSSASQSGGVVELVGNGDGTFSVGDSFVAGDGPDALAAGDFTGSGNLDLAVANARSGDVMVFQGDGHGGFKNPAIYAVEGGAQDQLGGYSIVPVALVAGYFDGDTHIDLAALSSSVYEGSVTVLINDPQGHGMFHYGPPILFPTRPTSLVEGDFNGDGATDLAVVGPADSYSGTPQDNLTLLLGNGDGSFQDPRVVPAGSQPMAVAATDLNADGQLDLAVTDSGTSSVMALLGTGTGSFVSPVLVPRPIQSTPLTADFTGDSTLDSVVLTETGQILFRRGLADQLGAFAPPLVLNPEARLAARDLAHVQNTGGTDFLVALDANLFTVFDGATAARVPRVTLYLPQPEGTFTPLPGLDLPAGFLPSNIASADLTGDGMGDLVITATAPDGSDQVFVSLQTALGVFGRATPCAVGVNPSAVDLVDVNGDHLLDIVVTDRFSGQVSVLLNQGGGVFAPENRFRAGTGLYGLTTVNGNSVVQSLEGTSGVVAGAFAGPSGTDLVVIHSGTDRFVLLPGDGFGGFFNPQAAQTVYTGASPTAIVTGHFIAGDDRLDLAVLSKDGDTVSIYRSDGQGGFTLIDAENAGNQPTGLSVADVTRPGGGGPDGVQDLLVGNAFGDLLILAGKGDGTFAQYRRAGQSVSLAVASSPGTGQATFYFSDQGNDQLAYATAAVGAGVVANPTVFQNRGAGIESPGPQAVVTVAGTQYLVVVNSGANSLLIYTLDQDGRPIASSKQTYFTGTNPVSLTATTPAESLNADTIPDLVVANEGSNDVSIFLGRVDPATNAWSLAYRPRQSSGGVGPTSVAVAAVPGSLPDLVVSNGQSNKVGVLLSQGDGYFSNQSTLLDTGNNPQEVFVGQFDGQGGLDLVTINAGSNDVTVIDNFMTAPVTATISSGGTLPLAGAVVDVRGVAELLVANAGNGVLEMLRFTSAGAEVVETAETIAPNLADLALVAVGNVVQVYGTDSGSEVALLLATLGPPPPVPDFLPPSPGFATGIELAGPGSTNPDLSSAFAPSAAAPGAISEIGPTAQAIAAVLTTTFVAPSTTSPDAPAPDSPGSGPGSLGPASPGNVAGILLLNLRDSRESSPAENRPDDLEQPSDTVPEMLPEATKNNPVPSHAVQTEERTADARMLDHFWQTLGIESLTGRAAVEPLQQKGRAACNLAAPYVIELTSPRHAVATQAPGPERSAAGESPPDLPARDIRPATASFAAVSVTLPLLVAHWLDAMRRTPSRLKTFLRKVWN